MHRKRPQTPAQPQQAVSSDKAANGPRITTAHDVMPHWCAASCLLKKGKWTNIYMRCVSPICAV